MCRPAFVRNPLTPAYVPMTALRIRLLVDDFLWASDSVKVCSVGRRPISLSCGLLFDCVPALDWATLLFTFVCVSVVVVIGIGLVCSVSPFVYIFLVDLC